MFHLIKKILIFLLPFIIIALLYIILDPFMVLYKYDNYNKEPFIQKNRDFISTEMYIKNSKKYLYDSFIFGSSNALFIPPSIWRNYIHAENNIFSFDASAENLAGVWSKTQYLNNNHQMIRFALVVIEHKFLEDFVNDIPIFMKHYKIYPSSRLYFHYELFLNYLDLRFLKTYVPLKIRNLTYATTGKILDKKVSYFDTLTNEFYYEGLTDELRRDSMQYYIERSDKFPLRTGNYAESKSLINQEKIQMLNDIKGVFMENNTDYRIIISPIYDQIAFNRKDLEIIKNIFGKENVFDFSGINEFTNKKSNFYDDLHFKPYVGKKMLDIVYSK